MWWGLSMLHCGLGTSDRIVSLGAVYALSDHFLLSFLASFLRLRRSRKGTRRGGFRSNDPSL